ncbi:MAG TPA: hypothetical protein VHB68_11860 [Steroidobacteraceae bacterium]|nr:hypothetical protein [Steroidobacteraceae bacterium]
MRSLVAAAASVAFACAMMVAPALADTTPTDPNNPNSPSYLQHAADCLALLFTNPKLHDQECGGPFHDLAQPPSGTTGYGSPCIGQISPQDIEDGVVLVAGGCCASLSAPANDFWAYYGLVPSVPTITDEGLLACR